jgi:hypothetical protein
MLEIRDSKQMLSAKHLFPQLLIAKPFLNEIISCETLFPPRRNDERVVDDYNGGE